MNNNFNSFSKLPTSFEILDKIYPINTDFRVWINVINLLENDELSDSDKLLSILMMIFKKEIPDDINLAIVNILNFLSLDKVREDKKCSSKVIDFNKDSEYIFASFMQQYNIDLYEEDLHWWKFMRLLNSLSPDTELMKIVSFRTVDLSSISDEKYRRYLRKMKLKYRLDKVVSENSISEALM